MDKPIQIKFVGLESRSGMCINDDNSNVVELSIVLQMSKKQVEKWHKKRNLTIDDLKEMIKKRV